MGRCIDGQDRTQSVPFPERLDDWIDEDNPVRAVDVFVDALDLAGLGFERAEPVETGRPAYHPATLLKIPIYGFLNRVQSSRRLEREVQRTVELIWLTGRLIPDFKTIADFRKNSREAIRTARREFVMSKGPRSPSAVDGRSARMSCGETLPSLLGVLGPEHRQAPQAADPYTAQSSPDLLRTGLEDVALQQWRRRSPRVCRDCMATTPDLAYF